MRKTNFIYFFVLFCIKYVRSNDVLGCGGFIKSHVPIDFSKIEVKLVTKQGIIKDKTTCAPNNGYYFVPLYDKGELILELAPPPGWSFTPKEVYLNIDGTDECSRGIDINFVFEGFGITGKVESLGSETGSPKGVSVQLASNAETRTTSTDENGNFFFTPVFPGSYKVSISHPKWKIYKQSLEVKVSEGNTELPRRSLIVQGYDVRGKITTEGAPVKDTVIILYTKEENKNVLVDGCNKEELKGLQFKKHFVCHVTSNSLGEFVFSTVPNGDYFVIPYYIEQNIYYQPDKIEFSVHHNTMDISESFQVVGFSIPGKVLNGKGIPIANAKVFLNGQEVTKTDALGVYKLEKIKVGTYKLRAEADDLIFEEIILKISPSSKNLPDLVPSAFKVCGIVTSEESQTVTFSQIGSTKFVQTETDTHGRFCQFLSPGKYEVQVNVNDEDKEKGLQFFPIKQMVEVISEKINDLLFSQLKANISGKVKCIREIDCIGLNVILRSTLEEVTLPVRNSSYAANDMHPGTYEVSISSNKLCWKFNKQTVNVNTVFVEIPLFIQSGYSITFVSSHDTKVIYSSQQAQKSEFSVLRGVTSFCLNTPGEYTFNIESCHSYENEVLEYNTNYESNQIELRALKHTIKMYLQSDGDYGDIKVRVKIGTDQKNEIVKYVNGKYELNIMLRPSEKAIITPYSDILYFVPHTTEIEGRNDCENLGVKLKAIRGIVFQGKVNPPLAEVLITVETENEEVLTIKTDTDGLFKFPPFDNQKKYKLSAKKEFYVLTGPDSSGNFNAHKLAEVVVKVTDGADRSPLSGALLSLSGGESYRRNLQTDVEGKIAFSSLSPNEYFLRPMMKEYEFQPSSMIIPVKEGETVNIDLVGKRIAYSAFGKVTSLNSDPYENIVVIASGLNNCSEFSEEATTDAAGQFRIRGLQPHCSYKIQVQIDEKNENQIERTAPASIEVKNINKDVKGLNIVIFRPISITDVLVKVYTENVDHYKSLKVKLHRDSDTDFPNLVYTGWVESSASKVIKDRNIGTFIHLPSLPMDFKTYSIQLDTVQNLKFLPAVEYFITNSSFKYVELSLVIKSNITEQPIKQTSIWTIVFIFSLLIGVYNVQVITDLLKDRFSFSLSFINSLIPNSNNSKIVTEYYDNADIDKIVQSINNVKRKPKKTN